MAAARRQLSIMAAILVWCILAGRTLTLALPQERVARETDDLDADDSDQQLWDLFENEKRSEDVEAEDVEMSVRADPESDEAEGGEGIMGFAERWINRIQTGLQRLGEMISWIREASKSISDNSGEAEKEARYFDPLLVRPKPGPLEFPPPPVLQPIPIPGPGGLHYPAQLPPFRFRHFRRPCCRHFPGFHRHFIGVRPWAPGLPPDLPVDGAGKDGGPEIMPPKETPVEEKPGDGAEGPAGDKEEDLGGIPEKEEPIVTPEELPKPPEEAGEWPEDDSPKEGPVEVPDEKGPVGEPETGDWPEGPVSEPEPGEWPEEGIPGNEGGNDVKPEGLPEVKKPDFPYRKRELDSDKRADSSELALEVHGGEKEARTLARDHSLKFLRRASNKRAVGA